VPSDDCLLILDVDESLIKATDPTGDYPEPPPPRIDFRVCGAVYPVMKRPFVDEFLRWCFLSRLFKTAFWSAGGEQYVKEILAKLLLPHEQPAFVFTNERCTRHWVSPDEWETDNRFIEIKDLKKIRKHYDLNKVLVLDDSYKAWQRSYGNLVHIRSFEGDTNDRELLRVQPFLEKWFQDPRGVRKIEKRGW